MTLYITTCCQEKALDAEPIPAIERYLAPRIKQVYEESRLAGAMFGILSGKYGLIQASEPILWYDEVLTAPMLPIFTEMVKQQLADLRVSTVHLFAKDFHKFPDWQPYYQGLYLPCLSLGLTFVFREITD